MTIKTLYKKCLQAHRINGIKYDRDTVNYWMPKELQDAMYWMLDAEPDHLWVKARRLNSGGKLVVLRSQFHFKALLAVR